MFDFKQKRANTNAMEFKAELECKLSKSF